MHILKKLLLLLLILINSATIVNAQIVKDPTTWTYEVKKVGDNKYDLIFHLKLKEHWHIWALNPAGDGLQLPPTFEFKSNSKYTKVGKIKEVGKMISDTMDGVDGKVNFFENKVDYVQTVEAHGNQKIGVTHSYQVCDESMCLPPKDRDYTFEITDQSGSVIEDTANVPITSNSTTSEPDSSSMLQTDASTTHNNPQRTLD